MTKIGLTLAMAVCACLASGQDAQVSGLIRDPANLDVADAEITLRNEQTGGRRHTKSNESGLYSLSALKPGVYRLLVRRAGFETIVREEIQLEVGESARLDFTLKIGDSRTTITVKGGPPLINSEDATVGTVIDRNIIDRMPLNGRGIQTLIELTPGVVAVPVIDTSRGQFVVNGQRSDANYFTVDGVSVNFAVGNSTTTNSHGGNLSTTGQAGGGLLPANNFLGTFSNLLSPDALQEFKIQTSTYAPEFGHLPGAQVGLISRSGTNKYSGSLFEYFRHDKTDASDWFNNARGIAKPLLRFNNFGGTFGGPVRLPRLYNGKDRTFFFFSVDELIARQPQAAITIAVPTASARQNAPPALAALLNAYPRPASGRNPNGDSVTTGLSQYVGSASLQYNQHAYGLRIDHYFSDKLTVFTRYNHAPSERVEANLDFATPSNVEHYRINTNSLTAGVTHAITPNLVNEVRWNGSIQSATDSSDLDESAGARRPPDSLLFPPGYSSADSAIQFGMPGSRMVYLGRISRNEARQLQVVDNLSYSRGTHRLKFGADYRWFSPVQVVPKLKGHFSLLGIYEPDGSYTSTASSVSTIATSQNVTAYVVPSFAAYAQDAWRLTPKLTVTYGVRWEVAPAPRTSVGDAVVAGGLTDLNDASNTYRLPAGRPFYPTSYTNLAPRLGIGWQLFNGPRYTTVLRAGVGRFFASAQGGFQDSAVRRSVVSGYTNQPLESIGRGIPSSQTTSEQFIAVAAAPGYNLPVTYQWNVTIEQAIGQQSVSMGYVGALGRRLIGYVAALPTYADFLVHVVGNNASSSYNAMQLQFNRRLSSRLQILASYTWSHSIDNLSNDISPQGLARPLSEYLDPDRNRGPSDFDVRHSLNGSVIADLPSPRQRILAMAFGNWSANSIFFARSALPSDILASDGALGRPNYLPGQPLYLYGSRYPGGKRYNPAAFANPPNGVSGNLGRNVARGFGAWQIDLGLHRKFRLSEAASLQLRIEAFNVLNHPNFANPRDEILPGRPNTLQFLPSPGFGVATSMLATGLGPVGVPGELNPLFQIGGPRTMQFALRLQF